MNNIPENISFYAGHLSRLATEEVITRRFSKYGTVLSVKVDFRPNALNKDDTIRYATVDMRITKESAVKCCHKLSNKKWFKQEVDVQKVNDRFFSQLEQKRIVVTNYDEIEREIEEYESKHKTTIDNAYKDVAKMLEEVGKCQESQDVVKMDDIENVQTKYTPIVSASKWFNQKDADNDDNLSKKGKTDNSSTANDSKLPNEKDMDSDEYDHYGERDETNYIPTVSASKWFNKKDTGDAGNDRKQTDNFNDFSDHYSMLSNKKRLKSVKETSSKLPIKKMLLSVEKSSDGWKDYNNETNEHSLSSKVSNVANERRLKSLQEKKNVINERKLAVKRALSSTDAKPNKKVIFDDSGKTSVEADNSMKKRWDNKSKTSNKLFDSDDDEDDDQLYSFAVKAKYAGSKGEKLFELQSRFGDDERFRMDEKFYEWDKIKTDKKTTDTRQQVQEVQEIVHDDEEVQGQLKVLQSLIGNEHLTKQHTQPNKQEKPRVRFDPLIPEHEKFILDPQPSRDKKENKDEEKEEEKQEEKEEEDGMVTNYRTVSKERFYEVTDELKETLHSSEAFKFDFSHLHDESEDEKETDSIDTTDVPNLLKSLTNFEEDRFGGDFYSYENENDNENENKETPEIARRDLIKRRKLWGQNFFFSSDDPRFQEGVKFLQTELDSNEEADLIKNVYITFKKRVKEFQNYKDHVKQSFQFPGNAKSYPKMKIFRE